MLLSELATMSDGWLPPGRPEGRRIYAGLSANGAGLVAVRLVTDARQARKRLRKSKHGLLATATGYSLEDCKHSRRTGSKFYTQHAVFNAVFLVPASRLQLKLAADIDGYNDSLEVLHPKGADKPGAVLASCWCSWGSHGASFNDTPSMWCARFSQFAALAHALQQADLRFLDDPSTPDYWVRSLTWVASQPPPAAFHSLMAREAVMTMIEQRSEPSKRAGVDGKPVWQHDTKVTIPFKVVILPGLTAFGTSFKTLEDRTFQAEAVSHAVFFARTCKSLNARFKAVLASFGPKKLNIKVSRIDWLETAAANGLPLETHPPTFGRRLIT